MKHLQTLSLLLLSLILFTTCNDDNDLTVTLKQSGILKVQLTDKNNNSIIGSKVKLYTNFAYSLNSEDQSYSILYDTKTTDEIGSVDFGELNQGIYIVVSEEVKLGDILYNVMKPVQIISGITNNLVINPEDYVGKITLNVYMTDSYSTSFVSKVSNANVVLVNYEDIVDSMTHQQVLAKAVVSGKTDNNGKIVFENVPSNFEYEAYVFYTDTTAAWAYNYSNYIYVGKDEEIEVSAYVLTKDLLNIKSTLNLTVRYYGYDTNSNYDYHPVPEANVIVVDEDDYYNYNLGNASINTVNSYKLSLGTTNAQGNVILKNIPQGTYCKIFVYYGEALKTWYYSSVSVYDLFENYTIEVDEYELGLPN